MIKDGFIVKIRELLEINSALKDLSKIKCSGTVALKIARLLIRIQNDVEAFDKAYQQMVENHAQRDDNDNIVYTDDRKTSIKVKDQTAITKDYEELLDTNCEQVGKLDIDVDNLHVSGEVLTVLLKYKIID
jgi:hypothetical protein